GVVHRHFIERRVRECGDGSAVCAPGSTNQPGMTLIPRSFAARLGAGVLVAIAVFGLVGREFVPADPFAIAGPALAPPDRVHIFGTDDLGRDVFTGVAHGASLSLIVGLAAAGLSVAIGLVVGGMAGRGAGTVDAALMRLTEFAQA